MSREEGAWTPPSSPEARLRDHRHQDWLCLFPPQGRAEVPGPPFFFLSLRLLGAKEDKQNKVARGHC